MKRTLVLVPVILFLLILSCERSTPPETILRTDLFSWIKQNNVTYTLVIPTNIFSLQDTIRGTFEVYNESIETREFSFNYQQQYGFRLKSDGTTALYYPVIGNPAPSKFSLTPGDRKIFDIQSTFRNSDGQLISVGEYLLEVFLLDGQSPYVGLQIKVE